MIKIPSAETKKWSQVNSGELFGNIYSTFNCNFDTEGVLKQTRAPISIYSNSDDANFTTPVALVPDGDVIYAVTTDGVFEVQFNTANPVVTQVTTTGQPTLSDYSDATIWQNSLYVAGGDLKYYNGSSWNSTGLSGGTTTPITLTVFESLNYLAMGYASQIELINTSHSIVTTLIIPSEYYITSTRYREQKLFIATRHRYKGEAKMFIWNGSGTAAQSAYGVGSDWIFALEEYDSSIVAVTKTGQLLRFNGGGFTQIAAFPIYYTYKQWNYSDTSALSSFQPMGHVRNRGIKAFGDVLYINISNEIRHNQSSVNMQQGRYLDNMPSGIWCYDPKVGLYHYVGQTADKYDTFTASSLSNSTITLSGDTNAVTGDAVWFKDVGSITGMTASGQASGYIIKVASNQIKVARTRADAYDGDFITLGGSVTSAEIWIPNFKTSGNIDGSKSSAISVISFDELNYPPDPFEGHLIWGASCADPTTVTTTRTALNIFSLGWNVSRVVFQKIYSPTVTSAWRKVIVKYNNLYLDSDEIIVKYRYVNKNGLPTVSQRSDNATVAATWTSGTTFTITNSTLINGISLNQVEVGDECIISQGSGSPFSAHVSSITNNSGTFTVVLDETVPGVVASDTSTIRFTNFKKLGVIDNSLVTNAQGYAVFGLPPEAKSKYIQVALEMRGHELAIEEVIVSDKDDVPIN